MRQTKVREQTKRLDVRTHGRTRVPLNAPCGDGGGKHMIAYLSFDFSITFSFVLADRIDNDEHCASIASGTGI